jgi:tetratricopeptide (TPR) repeat protein
MKTLLASSCWLPLLLFTASSGCSSEDAASVVAAAEKKDGTQAPKPGPVADAPLDAARLDLLHLAWQAASAFPLNPHIKNRGRAQEKVVMACFDLDQPKLALQFAKGIADWRRGAALADYACYCVIHGDLSEVEHYLGLADQLANDVERDPNPQEWRRDTIKMKIARAYALMGKLDEATKHSTGTDPTSGLAYDAGWAATTASRAELITAESLGRELAAMDDILVGEGTGHAYSALVTCGRLYEKFYGDAERRAEIEKRIELTQQSKLPFDLRLSTWIHLAKVALDRGDAGKGLELYRKAKDLADSSGLPPDAMVAFTPQLAALRFRAGERDLALADFEAGMKQYHELRDGFRVTKRAEILRPFAESYHAIGDERRAAEVYSLVVEEGMENPNSRPRAEDVSETCLSMAKNGFRPDPKLLGRISEIVRGLGDPW